MAARLVRLTCPASIRALPAAGLLVVALIVALIVAAAMAAAPASAATAADYSFISGIGPTTVPAYAFSGSSPNGVTTDANGNVYVTRPAGIAKFNSSGVWRCDYTGDNGYTPGGSYGLDVENIHATIFLAESTNNRIVMIRPTANGLSGTVYEWKYQIGSAGTGNGQFNFPHDVAVDSNHLYVTDKLNHRIQKFAIDYNANTLTWEDTWGDGTYGSEEGEFWRPTAIAVNPLDHHVFVADSYNHRIQELETDGDFVAQWGVSAPTTDPLYFSAVTGIDVDADGNVYATDFTDTTSWVNKYSPTAGGGWERVTRLGGWGTADGQFKFPWACAVDPNGYLYVTDTQNQQLKKFARDTTPPEVHATGIWSVWTNDPRHPELIASDPTVSGQYTSGVAKIYYSMTGGATWYEYGEPLDFNTQGDNAVTYYAEDAVGNTSTQVTGHVYLDTTKPVTTVSGVPDGWSKNNVSVTLTPSADGLSPIASTQYRLEGASTWTTYAGPFAVSNEGITVFEYRSSDTAQNYETVKTVTVSIDKTAPVTTVSGVTDGWNPSNVSVTLTPSSDALSPVVTEYRVQGAPAWTTYTGRFSVTTEGTTIYEYRSTDGAGNVEGTKTVTVRVDKAAPVTTASGVPATWSTTPVLVTLTPSGDGPTPVASTEYRLQDAPTWTTYAGPFSVTAQGASVYEYRSTDGAGNTEAAKSVTVRIDSVRPVPKATANRSVKQKKTVKLPYRVNDTASPQAKVVIKIYRGARLKKTLKLGAKTTNVALTYSYKCKLPKGRYSWKVYATDLAGNTQARPGVRKLTVK